MTADNPYRALGAEQSSTLSARQQLQTMIAGLANHRGWRTGLGEHPGAEIGADDESRQGGGLVLVDTFFLNGINDRNLKASYRGLDLIFNQLICDGLFQACITQQTTPGKHASLGCFDNVVEQSRYLLPHAAFTIEDFDVGVHTGTIVMFEGRQVDGLLVAKGTVQAALEQARSFNQILHGSRFITFIPENLHQVFQNFQLVKSSGPCHVKSVLV